MKFSELAGYLDPLETTTGRNELVRILSELYRACSVDEIEQITYLIQGRLAPFFAPVEIGLGERMLVTAIAAAYGAPKDEVSKLYRQVSDLGLTAQSLAPQGTGRSPSVASVHKRLSEVASTSGAGSVHQKKLDLFAELLGDDSAALDGEEQDSILNSSGWATFATMASAYGGQAGDAAAILSASARRPR